MLKIQTRLDSALAILWANLFIFALPGGASAQIAEVTDAQLAIRNSTDTHVSIEIAGVLRRDGSATPVNGIYGFRSGDYYALETTNKAKVTGVAYAFFMRTPDGHESRWAGTSHGVDEHGHLRVDITKDTLQTHFQTRPAAPAEPPGSR